MPSREVSTIGIIEAARRIGIEMHRLYCWERYDIVKPLMRTFRTRQFRRYSKQDIERARLVKSLVDVEGYTLKAAARKLNENEGRKR